MKEIWVYNISHGVNCGWLERLRARSGPKTYFTERALLPLTGAVMCEVGALNPFHGASITVVGWHSYERDQVP